MISPERVDVPSPNPASSGRAEWLHWGRSLGLGGAMAVVPALYFAFVIHYATNVPSEDDWTLVPVIHAALHGQLSFGMLWALHDENRMLFPNLIFVAVGTLSHDDIALLPIISAVVFAATFFVFIVLFRSYSGTSLSPVPVFIFAVVWFSLADWSNALWGFQLAWYLILFCLMAMLYLLTVRRSTAACAFAAAAGVVASFCFLQGLVLWPVGAICIVWMLPGSPRTWVKSKRLLVWLAIMACTTVAALWGYAFRSLGCVTGGQFQYKCPNSTVSHYAFDHPVRAAEFLVVNIGNVIPNGSAANLWLSGVLGSILLCLAVFVVVRSVRDKSHGRSCLPVALIVFGLLFDVLIDIGRVQFLTLFAPSSTYTMPNLLILLAILTYGWGRIDISRLRARSVHALIVTLTLLFLVAQLSVSTNSGIANARRWDQHLGISARLVVNMSKIPPSEKGCYDIYGLLGYVIFSPAVVGWIGFAEDQEDHLNVFSAGQLQKYRKQGLPQLAPCTKPG
jgi:hypothetical protein